MGYKLEKEQFKTDSLADIQTTRQTDRYRGPNCQFKKREEDIQRFRAVATYTYFWILTKMQ